MGIIVWSTESVDTSAMFLAQSLDDTQFTKEANDDPAIENDIMEALRDPENKVIFYGIVQMPDWFVATFDRERMFNDPRNARNLIRRNQVMDHLRNAGFAAMRYYQVTDDTNFTSLRDHLGRRFDLVVRAGMNVVGTVDNAGQFNEQKAGVQFACTHIDAVAKYRVFAGVSEITNGGVIGAQFSEKRRLSFRETVAYESSAEVRQHLEKLFEDGTLTEEMGQGIDAWTEERYVPAAEIADADSLEMFRRISANLQESFDVDFCSFDCVRDAAGRITVTNVTASPSLQNDDVLQAVSGYFNELTATGRTVTKDKLLDMVRALSDEDAEELGKLLLRGRRAA